MAREGMTRLLVRVEEGRKKVRKMGREKGRKERRSG
jgi:hypothetical protein